MKENKKIKYYERMTRERSRFLPVVISYVRNLVRKPKKNITTEQWKSTLWGRIFSIPMTGGLWIFSRIHPRIEQAVASLLAKNWYFKPIPMPETLSKNALDKKKAKILEINKKIDVETKILDLTTFNELIDTFPLINIVNCGCRSIVKHCDNPLSVCLRLNWAVDISEKIPDNSKFQLPTKKELKKVLDLADKNSLIHMTLLTDPKLNHVYTICNCCDCCCIGFRMFKEHATPKMIGSKFVAKINSEKCKGCYHCINYRCRFRAILKFNEDGTIIDPKLEDKERFKLGKREWSENRKGWGLQIRKDPPSWQKVKANHSGKWFAKVIPNRCFGCGNCASPKYGCPEGAIEIHIRE